MTKREDNLENQLERISVNQEKMMSLAVRHERRLERMREEMSKAITVIYRLKLAADHAKACADKRAEAVEDLGRRLAAIEKCIAEIGENHD